MNLKKLILQEWPGLIFVLFLFSVVLLSIVHYHSALNPETISKYPMELHRVTFYNVSVMIENVKASFNGYQMGYFRTLYGVGIFLLMAISIFLVGKCILLSLYRVFKTKSEMSLGEEISLQFILGSFIWSLFWYFAGLLGGLNHWAIIMGILLTFSAFIFNHFHNDPFGDEKHLIHKMKIVWNEHDLFMKWIIAFIILILFSWSFFSVPFQSSNDVLISHMALPQFYIQTGKIIFDPYHLYTYVPQNTEMLVLWALLLKSEIAAMLLIWGFSCMMILFTSGFLSRYVKNWVVIWCVLALLSVPVIFYQTIRVKNDIPSAACLLISLFLLVEAFNKISGDIIKVKINLFLSALTLGIGLGHKLVGIPLSFFMSIAVVLYFSLHTNQKKNLRSFFLLWFSGLLIPLLPWLLRTWIETGNPLYPFLNHLFGNPLVKEWHHFSATDSIFTKGWAGISASIRSLIYGQVEWTWGPLLIILIFPTLFLKIKWPKGFSTVFITALLAWITTYLISFDIRFHIAPTAFVYIISIALICNEIFVTPTRIFRWGITGMFFIYLFYTFSFSKIWEITHSAMAITLSGYSPGNFRSRYKDTTHWVWIANIFNRNTSPGDEVALLENTSAYGLNRPFRFCGGYTLDKSFIGEAAKNSDSANELVQYLKNQNIYHLIAIKDYDQHFNNMGPFLHIPKTEMNLIQEMIDQQMKVRFQTPDHYLTWYSFAQNIESPIEISNKNCEDYPFMCLDQAAFATLNKDTKQAKAILQIIQESRMSREYKTLGTYLSEVINNPQVDTVLKIAEIYDELNYPERLFQFIKIATHLSPNDVNLYLLLSKFSYDKKFFKKSIHYLKEAFKIKPTPDIAVNLIKMLHKENRHNEAIQYTRFATERFGYREPHR